MSPARGALLAGAVLSFAAWSGGSTVLWIAGLGLALAGVAALLWAGLVRRRASVMREGAPTILVEGEPLRYDVRLRGVGWLPGTFRLVDELGPARLDVLLQRRGAVAAGLAAAPRGRYAVGPGSLGATDPLGLARVEVAVPGGSSVLVLPRVPTVDTLFLDRGRPGVASARSGPRQGGTEPHGVREYQDGEPMRAVHWATSARRGRLMVRELEDGSRDEAVVVLDLDARTDVGLHDARSVDEVVRAAAALVRAHAARGRRATLVVAGEAPVRHEVTSLGRDWEALLVELAALEPRGHGSTRAVLDGRLRGLRETSCTLVTAGPLAPYADALLARGAAAVVSIDAATYAGGPPSAAEPALLRLAAHGVPVAVVRRGDDLAAILAGAKRMAAGA